MATYQLISSVTVGSGGASSIDFTSIPATYTDLLVVCSIRYTGTPNQIADVTWIQFNSATTNQTSRMLGGAGNSTYSYTDTKIFGQANGVSSTASTFSNTTFYIPNYAGSTNKSVSIDGVTENNATTAYDEMTAGLWSNTAAITSITLKEYGGTKTMVQYSTAYLYGIKNS